MKAMLVRTGAALGAALLFATLAWGVTAPPIDPKLGRVEDREQLRGLLGQMEKAISEVDVEAALKLMHPEAVVTWQNAEVSRGHEQIRAYHARMVKGTAAIVKKYSTKAALGGPAVFYGDSAVAYGTHIDTYELTDGLNFTLNANWSTTAVKADGQWKVAALHFSTNLFDNALLNSAKRTAWIAGIAAFIAGLLIAFVVVRLTRKRAA